MTRRQIGSRPDVAAQRVRKSAEKNYEREEDAQAQKGQRKRRDDGKGKRSPPSASF